MTYVHKPEPPAPPVTLLEFLELVKQCVAEDVLSVPKDERKAITRILGRIQELLLPRDRFAAIRTAYHIKLQYPAALAELDAIREERRLGRLPSPPSAADADLKTVAMAWALARTWS